MVYIALASAVSYAAPVQVLEYFAPASVAYYALLRLQQVVSILSLSCPPSTLSREVEYIAPAPAVLLHLRLSWCTSRQHNQCLTPRQHWYCVLCASACCLCRTYCDCNRWLCFSPCRAHRLQLITLAASCAYMFTQQRLLLCSGSTSVY